MVREKDFLQVQIVHFLTPMVLAVFVSNSFRSVLGLRLTGLKAPTSQLLLGNL